mmetsp:Transcript_45731/g.127484  ORF Transcript_45731/g.127484 Transcript_45731/m.127484 type:complete len:126 (+) Transcript_45731:103-480(+)
MPSFFADNRIALKCAPQERGGHAQTSYPGTIDERFEYAPAWTKRSCDFGPVNGKCRSCAGPLLCDEDDEEVHRRNAYEHASISSWPFADERLEVARASEQTYSSWLTAAADRQNPHLVGNASRSC